MSDAIDIPFSHPRPPFQVGGSLGMAVSSYVVRPADARLQQYLLRGEFCYVLNSRQMGKSSLMVHTLQALEAAGHLYATVDISSLGTQHVTPEQWYRSIVADLWRGFGLFGQVNYQTWWHEQGDLPPVQKLQRFLREVLLTHFADQPLTILIDEIDSVLSLGFALDDFFALIRFCHNQRAVDAAYERLTFAIFGVATPSDLVRDQLRTPFNIGQAIPLRGFELSACQPLVAGLATAVDRPAEVLQEILYWTQGQPFLTQKLCALIWQAQQSSQEQLSLPPGTEANWVRQLVCDRILHQWELQDEPEHLRTIRDRLLRHPYMQGRLLGLYQQILRQGSLSTESSPEVAELLLSGLVSRTGNALHVKNPIYRSVFDEAWVNDHLQRLRPYSEAIAVWLTSKQQDSSRLLRGQALKEAQQWAQGKRLSDEDYQFLTASADEDNRAIQADLELAKAEAIADRLAQAEHNEKLQRRIAGITGLGFFVSTIFCILAVLESQRANDNEQRARQSEVSALVASAEGWFESGDRLDAVLQAIHAQQELKQLSDPDPVLSQQVDAILRKTILGVQEANRLSGHTGRIRDIAYHPDGQQIASVSEDATLKLWQPDGQLLHTLKSPDQELLSLTYSPTGDLLATGDSSGTVQLWNPQTGSLITQLQHGRTRVLTLAFSADGERLAVGTLDGRIALWNREGQQLQSFTAHEAMVRSVAFSPQGDLLVSSSADQTLKFWHPTTGRLLKTLMEHTATVSDVAFSPDGQQLASASSDKTVKLWRRDGQLLKTLRGHQASVTHVQFSPDGETLVSSSLDHDVRFWTATGQSLNAYQGISAAGKSLDFSPDGQYLVSSGFSENYQAILWRLNSPLYAVMGNHDSAVLGVAHSPVADLVASSEADGDISLWRSSGEFLQTLDDHSAVVLDLKFSPDGQTLASTSMDNTVRLWRADGTPSFTYEGHEADTARVSFAPDGDTIASVGYRQGLLQFWRPDGQALFDPLVLESNLSDVAWHPQADLLAIADADSNIQFWDPATQTQLGTVVEHTVEVQELAFDQTGNWLASGDSSGVIKLWPVAPPSVPVTPATELVGHSKLVWDVTFAPPTAAAIANTPFLVSASADKTIRFWSLEGEPLAVLDKHAAAVHRVAFSPDGQWLFSASSDETLIRWNLAAVLQLDPLEYACNWVADYLATNAEVDPETRDLCEDHDIRVE